MPFLKANFGLLLLFAIFLILVGLALFMLWHPIVLNNAKDFLAWCQAKAGEVLAAIMTAIVGANSAMRRSSDSNGNTNGTPGAAAPASSASPGHP